VVPDWLGDTGVRNGIKYLLERDRCEEEELRLRRERCALQSWVCEEWLCVENALEIEGMFV
jgi:hypothetical protein